MNTVAAHDPQAILSQIKRLRSFEFPVFGIVPSVSFPEHNIRAVIQTNGKTSLVVPFADMSRSSFTRFGTTEIAGTSVVPDFRAHRDTRPSNILNVHHVAKGPVTGKFSLLPDELHDENLDLIPDFSELVSMDYGTEIVISVTGITLCFLGGIATHGFDSLNSDRLSVIQSYAMGD